MPFDAASPTQAQAVTGRRDGQLTPAERTSHADTV